MSASARLRFRRPDGAVAALAAAGVLAVVAVTAAGDEWDWSVPGLSGMQPGALAVRAGVISLAVVLVAAVARRGRHAGWFHPLSLPFAAVTVMSLAAPAWAYLTRQPAGLLFAPGFEPGAASPLAAAVSVTAVEALLLVLAGYLAGAVVMLGLAPPAPASLDAPAFRSAGMRRAGAALMTAGAVAEAVVAWLGRGTAYGSAQFEYGATSVLHAAAATALLAGLVAVTLPADRVAGLRGLLTGRQWAVLGAYLLATALTGGRGGLISPVVYLAWVYSRRARAIPARWIGVLLLAALAGGAVITSHRSGEGLSPGSPGTIASRAVSSVSSPAWLTQETVAAVPGAVPYLHGSTYEAAAEGQLPGPLARHLGATTRTASAVFRTVIGFSDPDQGFAESLPSEAYLNFGLAGCLGAGLLLGALMGWAWRKATAVAVRPRDLLYPVLLAGLIAGFRSDALAQVKEVLYPMLAVWVLMAWYRVRPVSG